MRTLLAALTLLLLASTTVCAGGAIPEAKVSITSRGGTARSALDSFAQATNCTLKFSDVFDVESDFEYHVWLRLKDATPQRAARVLSMALGFRVQFDPAHSLITIAGAEETPTRGGTIKGYDVATATASYVAYQNTWGKARHTPAPNEPVQPERSAAEHLAGLLESLLGDDESSLTFAVVGDRLVLRDADAMHDRVRKCLDLLVAQGGGASPELAAESAILSVLKKAKPPLTLAETSRASLLAQMCDAAAVDFVIRQDGAGWLEEDLVSLEVEKDASVLDALNMAFSPGSGRWVIHDGCVTLGTDYFTPPGYRVFDVEALLQKLDAAYKRQRTEPGREDGFSGDLSSQGGIDVVVTALMSLLSDSGNYVMVETWGARVIVRGSRADVDTAETALKEMGWEAPKTNG